VLKRGNQPPCTIIGVLKNYHHDYLKQDYTPAMYRLDPTRTTTFPSKLPAARTRPPESGKP
jgi:hypothetical protein